MYDPFAGRFCSRDPIGFKGSRWSLYGYVNERPFNATDPSGMATCAAILSGSSIDKIDEANDVADHVGFPKTGDELVEFVKSNGCCTLWTFEHQGGDGNPGGTIGPDDNPILPNEETERKLAEAFSENWCWFGCKINIFACGGIDPKRRQTRKDIAKRTGCSVCGSAIADCSAKKQSCDWPPEEGKIMWPKECESPPRDDPYEGYGPGWM